MKFAEVFVLFVDYCLVCLVLFIMITLMGNAAKSFYNEQARERIVEWGLEHQYLEYHPRTGELLVINQKIRGLLNSFESTKE